MLLELDTGKFLDVHPYTDAPRSKSGAIVRTFSSEIASEYLAWHKDKENRIVIPIKNENWKLQYDNEIPISLNVGDVYLIDKEKYHRIIKGKNDLILFIKSVSIEFGNFY